MADAIVSGEIENRNATEFRADVSCLRNGTSGSIRGEFELETNGNDIKYRFRSSSPSRLVTRRSGITRYVHVVFRNATVTNRSNNTSITGATITLTARRSTTGRRTATLVITRPGRSSLKASGHLDDGRVTVNRVTSCRR